MTCQWVEEQIWALPLAEHSAATLSMIERHAEACAGCRELLAAERALTTALREPPSATSESSAGIVMAEIARQEQAGARRARYADKAGAGRRGRVWLAAGGIGITFGVYAYAALTGQFVPAPVLSRDGASLADFGQLGAGPATVVFAIGLGLFLIGLFGTRDRE